MKSSIFSKTLALILCLLLAFSAFSVNVFAANEDADLDMGDDIIIPTLPHVYVSSSGSDSNDGSEVSPFGSLDKALTRVSNGGTIHIVGSFTVPSTLNWVKRNVTPVTITGGTLNLNSGNLVVGYNVIFDAITISKGTIFANGNDVTFNSNITTSGLDVYGGGESGDALESTSVTILGGTFNNVYGGGTAGTIGCTNLYIKGGTITNVYGGSNGVNHAGDVNVEVTDGTISNLFGGNNASNLTGDVNVFLDGGTIKDSIFGGCNNAYEYKDGFMGNIGASITWSSSCFVNGEVKVIVSEKATINTNNSSGKDKAFFAHSRHKTNQANEVSYIIFTSQKAYDNNEGKFGTKTSKSGLGTPNNLAGAGMGTTEASSADNVHIHGISVDSEAATITEGCTAKVGSACGTTSIATLSISNKVSLTYTGEEITPAVATVTGTLSLGEPTITYSNNVNPGTATATMTYGTASVSKEFTIKKASQSTPKGLVPQPETISGLADGKILGLTTAMEYSTDDTTFTPVTDTAMKFAAGTYYIRYAETEFNLASSSYTVTVDEGKKFTVTFIADGKVVDTKYVSYGANVTDIPDIPAKTGYDKVAPYWDNEVNNVTSDLTINAVYTINTYTVTYIADGKTVSTQTVNYGEDAVAPEIPAKEGYTSCWDGEAIDVKADLTINAVYIIPADTNNDGKVNLKDLVTLAQYVAGWKDTKAYLPALDINGDSDIDLDDVNTLARYLAGWDVKISNNPYLG